MLVVAASSVVDETYSSVVESLVVESSLVDCEMTVGEVVAAVSFVVAMVVSSFVDAMAVGSFVDAMVVGTFVGTVGSLGSLGRRGNS